MNSAKTLKNSIISVIAQILTLLLHFINRRVFVMYLDIEYLGYQSVFGNVFSILSVADLGIGGIISFHLYREIAAHNEEEIGKLMYLYKWVYRIIAILVAILGLVACVFVPYIVKDAKRDIGYLYAVYFLQLASTVAGYFLSYRRTIFIADQKEYKVIEIDLFANAIVQILQLGSLVVFKNYLLYLAIQLSTSVIANLVVLKKSNQAYPYLKKKYKITREDIQKRNIIPDMKNFLVHKISYAVYGGTDNIIISAVCGIRDVALFGNYLTLKNSVLNIMVNRLLNPMQAAIGNIVYSERKKSELWSQFEMFDVFSFFFGSYIGLGFLAFFQPAIQIWLGKGFLLPDSFVVVSSISIYFSVVWQIVAKYRSAFGNYAQDRNCMVLSAVLNIATSIPLAYRLGVTGVQIGTLVAYFPIAYGRIRFVVRNYFGHSLRQYMLKHGLLFCIVFGEGIAVYFATREMPVTFVGILLRFIVWFAVPTVVNTLVYCRSQNFKNLCQYLKSLISIVWSRLARK